MEHHPFPSHTAQNLLRRSWTSYAELHGSDDVSPSDPGGHDPGVPAQHRRRPPSWPPWRASRSESDPAAGGRPPIAAGNSHRAHHADAETRVLPWWKVTSDGK
ncbi:hypothetical protein ACW23B_27155 [Streptomyces albidoflavus]